MMAITLLVFLLLSYTTSFKEDEATRAFSICFIIFLIIVFVFAFINPIKVKGVYYLYMVPLGLMILRVKYIKNPPKSIFKKLPENDSHCE